MKLKQRLFGAVLFVGAFFFVCVFFVVLSPIATNFNECLQPAGQLSTRDSDQSIEPAVLIFYQDSSNSNNNNNQNNSVVQINLTEEIYDVIETAINKIKAPKSRHREIQRLLKKDSRSDEKEKEAEWRKFNSNINSLELYSETTVDDLLESLSSQTIVDVVQRKGGTQLKLTFTLADGSHALFKPMRYSREIETNPNHFYFSDFERHNAEIAAFHLDRVLGFHRVPPVAGRWINITRDIEEYADHALKKTVFISPAGNKCFHGTCSYYCDGGHAFCGRPPHPDLIEGSMATYLPVADEAERVTVRNPWRRSYSKQKRAEWEDDPDYCQRKVITAFDYSEGRRLNDVIDLTIFDFFTGNMDRHHYELFKAFGDGGYPVVVDNGRGFGKSQKDEMSILVPLVQCCRVRRSTVEKLVELSRNVDNPLSDRMRSSLARDKLSDLLTERHLKALDRRVAIVLKTVHDCLQQADRNAEVIVDDGY